MCFNLTLNLHLYDMYNTRECNAKHGVHKFQLVGKKMPSLIVVITLCVLTQLHTAW